MTKEFLDMQDVYFANYTTSYCQTSKMSDNRVDSLFPKILG